MSSSSAQPTTTTRKIDISSVQPADIIVTRNEHAQSKIIRAGSCSTYSHAILALDNGLCIESTGKGTGIEVLSDALDHSSYGALYRHKAIDANYAAWICYSAEQNVGKPYDYGGALRAGVITGCKPIRSTLGGVMVQIIDDNIAKGEHDKSFFCSELVVRAFEEGCLPIIQGNASTATPQAIASSSYLKYVKDVVIT